MKKVTTVCPQCSTNFFVSPKQLGASNGRVRCGKCGLIFNALETIVLDKTEEVAAQARERARAREAAPEPPLVERRTQPPDGQAPRPPAEERRAPVRKVRPDSVPPRDNDAPPPLLVKPVPGEGRTNTWQWALAAAAMALILVLQLGHVFRNQLARDHPGMKPALEGLCALTGCDVELSKDADQVTIEASELLTDPQRSREITLAATVRNRARYVQAYPLLELTFTDGRDQPIARKILRPADYLESTVNPRLGLNGNAEISVRLRFDSGGLNPIGYRLMLFYP